VSIKKTRRLNKERGLVELNREVCVNKINAGFVKSLLNNKSSCPQAEGLLLQAEEGYTPVVTRCKQ